MNSPNFIGPPSRYFLGTVFIILITLSFLGNVLVCIAVYSNGKLHKRENFYFVSLAGADLLLSLLVMPFSGVSLVLSSWPFGWYCKYWICMDILCCTASIFHLAAISFDRYIHIKDSLRYQERMTVGKIILIILSVWIVSAVVAFLPLALDSNFHNSLITQYTKIDHNGSDHVMGYQCRFDLHPLYAIFSSLTSFYIPCILIIMAYGRLYRYARHHSMAIRKQKEEICIPLLIKRFPPPSPSPSSPITSKGKADRTFSRNRSIRRRAEGDQKARVTVGVIVGAFVTSWLPFFMANVLRSFCDHGEHGQIYCPPDWLFAIFTWLGYANSAQNPIIYSLFNREFRKAFRRILLCRKGERNGKNGE